MEPLVVSGPAALRWVRADGHPESFDLLSAESPVGRLQWKHRGGSLAIAETKSGSWTLKRLGLLQPHITLRRSGSEVDIARLSVHFRQSLLEIGGRPVGFLRRAGYSVPAWTLTDLKGLQVAHIEPVSERMRLVGGTVNLDAPAANFPEIEMALLVSWYFIALEWTEEELAAATVSSLVAVS